MGKILIVVEHPDVEASKLKEMVTNMELQAQVEYSFEVDAKKSMVRITEQTNRVLKPRQIFDTSCEIIDDRLCVLDEVAPTPTIAEAAKALQNAYRSLAILVEQYDDLQDQQAPLEDARD